MTDKKMTARKKRAEQKKKYPYDLSLSDFMPHIISTVSLIVAAVALAVKLSSAG